jgi:hypothetical protein
MWFDEAMSWRTVTLPWSEMLASVARNTHAPFFFIVLKSWVEVWGDSLVSLRSLNVLLAVLTLLLIAVFFRAAAVIFTGVKLRRENRRECLRAARIAMVLFAVSPLQIRVASEVRMYPLLVLLLLCSSWLLLRWLAHPRNKWRAVTFSGSILLMLYTHYFGLFLIASQFLFLFGWAVQRSLDCWGNNCDDAADLQWQETRRCWVMLSAILLGVGLGWSVWLPVFLDQQQRVTKQWWTNSLATTDLVHLGVEWIGSGRAIGPEASGWVALGVLVGSLFVVLRLIRLGTAASFYLACCFVVPLLLAVGYSWLGRNLMVSRYFAPIHLLWLLGVALSIASIRSGWWRDGVFAVLVLLSLIMQWTHLAAENVWHDQGIVAAVSCVEHGLQEHELVVVDSSLIYFPATFVANDRKRWRLLEDVNPLSFSTGLPVLTQSDRVDVDDLRSSKFEGLWVVSSGSQRIYAPDVGWTVDQREFFAGSVPFQETVIVTHFKRSRGTHD